MSNSWKPEVIADSSGKYFGNALRFATKAEAEANARDLSNRWFAVTAWRATESEDPPNYSYVNGQLAALSAPATNPLDGMTQAKWDSLSSAQRDAIRSDAGLTKQLIGLEGWRVETVSEMTGEKRRFIVGRSSGWIPCHIEMRNRASRGGTSASASYKSVRAIEKIR